MSRSRPAFLAALLHIWEELRSGTLWGIDTPKFGSSSSKKLPHTRQIFFTTSLNDIAPF
jgi:hypothetical protein